MAITSWSPNLTFSTLSPSDAAVLNSLRSSAELLFTTLEQGKLWTSPSIVKRHYSKFHYVQNSSTDLTCRLCREQALFTKACSRFDGAFPYLGALLNGQQRPSQCARKLRQLSNGIIILQASVATEFERGDRRTIQLKEP